MTTTELAPATINQEIKNHLLLQFDAELSRLRYELLNQLGSIDILNSTIRDSSIQTFCQRLEVMQFAFLQNHRLAAECHDCGSLLFTLLPRYLPNPTHRTTRSPSGKINAWPHSRHRS